MKTLNLIVAILVFQCSFTKANDEIIRHKPSIKDLDWLIGKWKYTDRSVTGSYTDEGIRECHYTLNDSYIVCLSNGITNKGKSRSYYFYFNYNHKDMRYQMTSLTSDYPKTDVYAIELSQDHQTLELKNYSWEKEGLKISSEATISYDGEKAWNWDIRSNIHHKDPKKRSNEVTYQDRAVRIK